MAFPHILLGIAPYVYSGSVMSTSSVLVPPGRSGVKIAPTFLYKVLHNGHRETDGRLSFGGHPTRRACLCLITKPTLALFHVNPRPTIILLPRHVVNFTPGPADIALDRAI